MSFSRNDVEAHEKGTPTPVVPVTTAEVVKPSDVVVEKTEAEEAAVETDEQVEIEGEEPTAEPSEEADAAASEAAVTDDGSTKPKKANPIPKRIEELLGDNAALRKYADFWRNKAVEGTKPSTTGFLPETTATPAPVGEEPPVAGEPPTLESCKFDTAAWTKAVVEYNAKYLKAVAAYTDRQIQTGVTKALAGAKQTESAEQVKASYEAKCTAWAATHPDFNMLISNPALPHLDRGAAQYLLKSDLAAELTDYLARNPDKAERIARSTPEQQAAAIGRLEGDIARAAAATPVVDTPVKVIPKKPTTLTKAPSPPSKTPSGSSPGKTEAELMAGPMDEFVAHERAQEKAKRENLRKLRIKR
jgi:hypothetical protein